jgi:Icc protein
MLLAQITDPHIKTNRRLAYGRVDTTALFESVVAHVNRFSPAIDAAVITGDLTDSGRSEEFQAVQHILDRLTMPWYAVPGNHDQRDNFLQTFGNQNHIAGCGEFIQYAIDDYPLRLVGLDTLESGKPYGFLCRDRLSWLDECLREELEKPTLIFQHHPPFEVGIRHMDVQNLQNADELFEVLAHHPQVRHIACGHIHRTSETCINGITVSIAPNSAHSTTLDLDPDGPSTFTIEPPALRLFNISEGGNIVSHISFIGDFDGPHPYFAADGSLVD